MTLSSHYGVILWEAHKYLFVKYSYNLEWHLGGPYQKYVIVASSLRCHNIRREIRQNLFCVQFWVAETALWKLKDAGVLQNPCQSSQSSDFLGDCYHYCLKQIGKTKYIKILSKTTHKLRHKANC